MDRIVKYRGKSESIGKWVYGNILQELSSGKMFIENLYCFYKDTKLVDIVVEVKKETVGQYTGLKDKNGKEIYEGDIVEVEYKDVGGTHQSIKKRYRVEYDKYKQGYMPFLEIMYEVGFIGYPLELNSIEMENVEVIGNKFDNPEFIEEE